MDYKIVGQILVTEFNDNNEVISVEAHTFDSFQSLNQELFNTLSINASGTCQIGGTIGPGGVENPHCIQNTCTGSCSLKITRTGNTVSGYCSCD